MTEEIGEFKSRKRPYIGFVPTTGMLEQLKRIAKEEDRPLSGQIRVALSEWLDTRDQNCRRV